MLVPLLRAVTAQHSTTLPPSGPAPEDEYSCTDKNCWAEVVLALIVGGQLLIRALLGLRNIRNDVQQMMLTHDLTVEAPCSMCASCCGPGVRYMLEFVPMLAPGFTLFVPYMLIPAGLCSRTVARLLMGAGIGIAMMGGGLMIMRTKCGHMQSLPEATTNEADTDNKKDESMGKMLRQGFGACLMSSGLVFFMTCVARGLGVSRDRAILVSGMSFGVAVICTAALRLVGGFGGGRPCTPRGIRVGGCLCLLGLAAFMPAMSRFFHLVPDTVGGTSAYVAMGFLGAMVLWCALSPCCCTEAVDEEICADEKTYYSSSATVSNPASVNMSDRQGWQKPKPEPQPEPEQEPESGSSSESDSAPATSPSRSRQRTKPRRPSEVARVMKKNALGLDPQTMAIMQQAGAVVSLDEGMTSLDEGSVSLDDAPKEAKRNSQSHAALAAARHEKKKAKEVQRQFTL